MKVYFRNGVVIATHSDEQDIPAEVYGEGVTVETFAPGEDIDYPILSPEVGAFSITSTDFKYPRESGKNAVRRNRG